LFDILIEERIIKLK